MQIFSLFILGLIQGITEFLPVSSSGHLVLLGKWFGIEDNMFVSIVLHVATLLAVVVCLRKEIWEVIKHPFGKLAIKLYMATIPTCVIVLILMPIINRVFTGSGLVFTFLLSAIILFCADLLSKKKEQTELSNKQTIIMGIAQGFAALPGLSRSGTTISAGIISGANREESAKFSFLMSIPIILMSMVLEIYKICIQGQVIAVNTLGLILAFGTAFVVGILSIKFMLKISQKANFKWFALYLVCIAIVSALF